MESAMKHSTRRFRSPVALSLLALLIFLTGCASTAVPTRVNYYRGDNLLDQPKRLLVLPFLDVGGPGDAPAVQQVFGSELMKIGLYDLISIPEDELTRLEGRDVRIRGTFALEDLVELSEQYGADAVLIGTVTDHRPYPPLRLGLRAEMISTRTGMVLWSADALFDTNDRGTRHSLESYHGAKIAATDSLLDWEVLLVSMDRVTRFVCNRVVDTIHPVDASLSRN